MSTMVPFGLWGLIVPAHGNISFLTSGGSDASVRITMAAIDPFNCKPGNMKGPVEATTLRILRDPGSAYIDSSSEGESLSSTASVSAGDEGDYGNPLDMPQQLVVCVLEHGKNIQQTLDIFIRKGEKVFFEAVGRYDIHLTGQYLIDPEARSRTRWISESDTDSDYPLFSSDLGLPVGSEDEIVLSPPKNSGKLSQKAKGTRINDTKAKAGDEAKSLKRIAGSEKESAHGNLHDPAQQGQDTAENSAKPSKKAKGNDGKPIGIDENKPKAKLDKKAKKDTKKAQPTKGAEGARPAAPANKKADKPAESPQKITHKGVSVIDVKVGTGAVAKKGSRLSMRYTGKLENGKAFDSNTHGKPFTFKLGKGEVIKGWDVGLLGMRVGGERKLEISPEMAYGQQQVPGIPVGSKLLFDVKLVDTKP